MSINVATLFQIGLEVASVAETDAIEFAADQEVTSPKVGPVNLEGNEYLLHLVATPVAKAAAVAEQADEEVKTAPAAEPEKAEPAAGTEPEATS